MPKGDRTEYFCLMELSKFFFWNQGSLSFLSGVDHLFFADVLLSALRFRIRMILGLLYPDPDPIARGTEPDPAPDPDTPIIKQK